MNFEVNYEAIFDNEYAKQKIKLKENELSSNLQPISSIQVKMRTKSNDKGVVTTPRYD